MACKLSPKMGYLAISNQVSSDPMYYFLPDVFDVTSMAGFMMTLELTGVSSVSTIEATARALYSNDGVTWIAGLEATNAISADGISFSDRFDVSAGYRFVKFGVEALAIGTPTFATANAILTVTFHC